MRIAAIVLLLSPAFAETKVLKNFTLIDGTGKPASVGMAMVVVNGRVHAVGPASSIKTPPAAEVVDLTGKFVMPGIINLHGHVGTTVDMSQDAKFYTRENVERQLQTYASYGVTTVVSLGTDFDPIYQIRSEQRATGRPHMARVYTAGRGFVAKGGFPPASGMRYEVETPADCAADVAELAAKKVDFVKIWVDDRFGRDKKLPIELSRAIIKSAHQHRLRVAAHMVNLEDARQLVDTGVYGLAHSVRDQPVDQALIDAMKTRGVWQMAATLTREISTFIYVQSPKFLDDPFFTRSVSPRVIETLKSPQYIARIKSDPDFPKFAGLLDMAKRNLKRLSDAGVKIGFGTDSGPPGRFQGYFEQWEMELMTEAGLTPMQVILAATKNSAEFLGARDLGTLERGKWADLIVLAKNPLEDIRNTRSIESVYIAGAQISH
jgi:imidazolonepropionase-like amidohydrolase